MRLNKSAYTSAVLFVGTLFITSGEAACISNETDRQAQVQLGESWNQVVGPGESKCAEGQGGLVSVWLADEPGTDTAVEADSLGVPQGTGDVSAGGTVKIERAMAGDDLVIYGADGELVSRSTITSAEQAGE